MTAVAAPSPIRLVDIGALALILGISRSKAWKLVKEDPDAPKPVKVGLNSTRFRTDDIERYVDSLSGN